MAKPHLALKRCLANLDQRLSRSGPNKVVADIGRHVQGFPENAALTAEQQSLLEEAAKAIKRIHRKHGRSEESFVVELMTLGKLGRFGEAVRRARAAFAADPTWMTAIAAGNALRRAGQLPAAVEMFSAAAELDHEDVTALLEVGDIELEAGRIEQALAAYESALGREKKQAWAEPSAWYCRYRLTNDKKSLRKLRQAAAEPPDECGVEDALAALFGGYTSEQKRLRAAYLLHKLENDT
jgi:tetratricopeptide (TPR) repeat protein